MITRPKESIEAAAKLPQADRVRIAERILATLDGERGADTAEAWTTEIDRRTGEIEEGRVQPTPWADVKDTARRKTRDDG